MLAENRKPTAASVLLGAFLIRGEVGAHGEAPRAHCGAAGEGTECREMHPTPPPPGLLLSEPTRWGAECPLSLLKGAEEEGHVTAPYAQFASAGSVLCTVLVQNWKLHATPAPCPPS